MKDIEAQLAQATRERDEWRHRYSSLLDKYNELKAAVLAANRLAT